MLFSIKLVKVKQVWLARILGVEAFRDREYYAVSYRLAVPHIQFRFCHIVKYNEIGDNTR